LVFERAIVGITHLRMGAQGAQAANCEFEPVRGIDEGRDFVSQIYAHGINPESLPKTQKELAQKEERSKSDRKASS
jgi:hypothetical protein